MADIKRLKGGDFVLRIIIIISSCVMLHLKHIISMIKLHDANIPFLSNAKIKQYIVFHAANTIIH